MAEITSAISDIALARLHELARWAGTSVDAALERAIDEQYERNFWEATNVGYAALRADPVTCAEVEEEQRLLEGTLMDGLDPSERWTDDGTVISPVKREQAS
jgi:hypothetical protein